MLAFSPVRLITPVLIFTTALSSYPHILILAALELSLRFPIYNQLMYESIKPFVRTIHFRSGRFVLHRLDLSHLLLLRLGQQQHLEQRQRPVPETRRPPSDRFDLRRVPVLAAARHERVLGGLDV